MLKLMGKKIIHVYAKKICLSKPMGMVTDFCGTKSRMTTKEEQYPEVCRIARFALNMHICACVLWISSVESVGLLKFGYIYGFRFCIYVEMPV